MLCLPVYLSTCLPVYLSTCLPESAEDGSHGPNIVWSLMDVLHPQVERYPRHGSGENRGQVHGGGLLIELQLEVNLNLDFRRRYRRTARKSSVRYCFCLPMTCQWISWPNLPTPLILLSNIGTWTKKSPLYLWTSLPEVQVVLQLGPRQSQGQLAVGISGKPAKIMLNHALF